MLVARRCPHTGIINFYSESEPHFAVGSIARCGTDARDKGFAWRCYAADEATSSGLAPDLTTAERRLVNFYAMVADLSDERRQSAA